VEGVEGEADVTGTGAIGVDAPVAALAWSSFFFFSLYLDFGWKALV
jgi:hypothetical protein